MWIEHILQLIKKYMEKTPENFKNYLDINLDLPFAKLMIELLKPSIHFYVEGSETKLSTLHFKGVSHFVDWDIDQNKARFRYYLQKTIMDEISEEYFSSSSYTPEDMKTLYELLNRIVDNINTEGKCKDLLKSIHDIISNNLF